MKRIHISSSIANFKERLRARYADYSNFVWFSKDPTIFFGMYHLGDYMRYVLHRGPKTIFWCGSDIQQIKASLFILAGTHICENIIEQDALLKFEITSTVHPMLFDAVEDYPAATYVQSDQPSVWMTAHPDRLQEYGISERLDAVGKASGVSIYCFTDTPRDEFLQITERMQGTIRLNMFDGFSENVALALLRGQYVYSVIPYRGAETVFDEASLVERLKELKTKFVPNDSHVYWRERLSNRVEV